eukprot:scaffold8150_cov118-Cylindrotheca_fusiformis.AAC.15
MLRCFDLRTVRTEQRSYSAGSRRTQTLHFVPGKADETSRNQLCDGPKKEAKCLLHEASSSLFARRTDTITFPRTVKIVLSDTCMNDEILIRGLEGQFINQAP